MQESSSELLLTKVKATVLGWVHEVMSCPGARRSRDEAATPKNARHRERAANKDFLANISCATVRRLVRSREKVQLAGENGFELASL